MGIATLRRVQALALLLLAATVAAQPAGWTRLDGPHAAGLRTAAVGPTGTLLAATHVDLLRHGGSTWTSVAGAVNGSIHDISTAAGGRVWAGTSGALRSDDGGLTWQWFSIRTAPHSGTHPAILHVAQSPTGVVYAGAFMSTNGGASWPQMSIYAMGTAFVGTTTYAGTTDGVHRSGNGGVSWTPSGLQGIAVDHMAATGSRLVAATSAGILISDDGITWTPTCTLPQVTGLAVSGDGAVWASAPTGLYRSPDGVQWPIEPTAFAGQMVEDVAANGSTLLAIVEGNPYRSTDAGVTWEAVHDGLGMPFASSAAAAAGVVGVAANGAGPFRSVDAGATWTRWTDGLASQSVTRLIFDGDDDRAFAETFHGIYRATLSGGTWSAISLPDQQDPAGLAYDGSALIAVVDGDSLDHVIYRSADAGTTWTLAHSESDSFQPVIAAGGGVTAVGAVGFFGPARILISTDAGVTWTSRPHPTMPVFGFSPPLFVDDAGRIYVEDGNRLLRSDDAATTWVALGEAGSSSNHVRSLHADADALCLGTSEGVWCSTDDGATFSPASAGLPGGSGTQVVGLVRDGQRYVALTSSDGVFVSDGVTSGAPEPGTGEGLSIRVAPNPTLANASAAVEVDAPSWVSVVVFDAIGRQVATLHEGPLAAGVHAFPIRADALPPGSYVLRVAGADRSASTVFGVHR